MIYGIEDLNAEDDTATEDTCSQPDEDQHEVFKSQSCQWGFRLDLRNLPAPIFNLNLKIGNIPQSEIVT